MHLQVLGAHQSRICLLVGVEGQDFQIEKHETHAETLQICLAEQQVCLLV